MEGKVSVEQLTQCTPLGGEKQAKVPFNCTAQYTIRKVEEHHELYKLNGTCHFGFYVTHKVHPRAGHIGPEGE